MDNHALALEEVEANDMAFPCHRLQVADDKRSVILEQVANGVAIRMAVLYLLARNWDAEQVA